MGADDYFLENTFLQELHNSRVKNQNSIITPIFQINSLSSRTSINTRGQYNNRLRYIRLFRFLIANHHHSNRFNLGLFSKEMFLYRLSRESYYSKKFHHINRNGIGEFFTLIDLILKYKVVVNKNVTYIKEVNNRSIHDVREVDTQPKVSKLKTIANLTNKNLSTYRLLKQRNVTYKLTRDTYLLFGFFSFIRNSTYDLYVYCRKILKDYLS